MTIFHQIRILKNLECSIVFIWKIIDLHKGYEIQYNTVLTPEIESNFLLTPGLHTFMISSDLFNHHINITNM